MWLGATEGGHPHWGSRPAGLTRSICADLHEYAPPTLEGGALLCTRRQIRHLRNTKTNGHYEEDLFSLRCVTYVAYILLSDPYQ